MPPAPLRNIMSSSEKDLASAGGSQAIPYDGTHSDSIKPLPLFHHRCQAKPGNHDAPNHENFKSRSRDTTSLKNLITIFTIIVGVAFIRTLFFPHVGLPAGYAIAGSHPNVSKQILKILHGTPLIGTRKPHDRVSLVPDWLLRWA